MKLRSKIWLLSGLISFLFLSLEWGHGQKQYVFEIIPNLLQKGFHDPMSVVHPFTLLPLAGFLILCFNLFSKSFYPKLSWTAISLLSVLVLMLLFISILKLNLRMAIVPLLFIICMIGFGRSVRQKRN